MVNPPNTSNVEGLNASQVDPLSLPSLPLAKRCNLPDHPGIYFVMQGNCVLYIGQTVSLVNRLASHHRLKEFLGLSGDIQVAWLDISNAELLKECESALIKHFQPPLNRARIQFPLSKDKSFVTTVVSVDSKNRLQRIATVKKWTLSHTVKLFIESFIDTWEKELGVDSDLPSRTQRSRTKNPTPAVAATTKTKRGKAAAQQQNGSGDD